MSSGSSAWWLRFIGHLFSRKVSDCESRGKPYRLGLLFVHGMGEQERGDTVTEMGDALTEWLRRWIAEIPKADFKIREATLRTEGGASVGPSSHVSVVLSDDAGASQEWLLAESWWAGAFRPATFKELAVWAASVGPWLIASQGSGIHRRLWTATATGWSRLWRWPLRLGSSVVIALLAALVAAVVTPSAFVLLLVSLVPIPVVSDIARRLAHNLAGSFGDLLVLVRSPVRFAAMAERVRDDIARLDAQCERVMVVAHSQGSAVAWQGIKRAAQQPACDRPEVALFVSFGQAMRKLKSLYRLHEVGGSMQTRFSLLALLSSILLVVVLVAGVLALAEVLVREGELGTAIGDWDWHWIALLAGAGGVLVVQLILQAMATANDGASEIDLVKEIRAVRKSFGDFRWVDLWASADPAPNGPLLAARWPDVEPYVASYKLRNMGSTALDHSVYWSNVTEFVSAIAYMASGLAWPNATGVRSFAALREAVSLRDWRVNMLAVARVVFFAGVGFGIFGARGSLVGWGRAVRGFIGGLPLVPDDWFANWPEPIEGLLAAALIGVVAILIWLLLLAFWAGPIRSDEAAFFKGRPSAQWSAWAILWFVAAVAIPAGVLAVAILHGEVVFAVAYAATAFVASVAVVSVLSAGGKRLYEAPSDDE